MKKAYVGGVLALVVVVLFRGIRKNSSTLESSINFKTQTVVNTTVGTNAYASVCANFPMMSAAVCNKLAQVYINTFGTNPLFITPYCLPFSNRLPSQTCQQFITQVIAVGNGSNNNANNNSNNNNTTAGGGNVIPSNPNNNNTNSNPGNTNSNGFGTSAIVPTVTVTPGSPIYVICNNYPSLGMIRCYTLIQRYLSTYGSNPASIIAFCNSLSSSVSTDVCEGILNSYFNGVTPPVTPTNTGNNGTGNTGGTGNNGGGGGGNASFVSCESIIGIPSGECQALVELYKMTQGTMRTKSDGWVQTNTPCSWYGITCENGHVTSVMLANNKLVGSLLPSLGGLSVLKTLNISSNEICGRLPSTMYQWWPAGAVPSISLSNNKFVTDLPSYSPEMQTWITQNITRGTQNMLDCN